MQLACSSITGRCATVRPVHGGADPPPARTCPSRPSLPTTPACARSETPIRLYAIRRTAAHWRSRRSVPKGWTLPGFSARALRQARAPRRKPKCFGTLWYWCCGTKASLYVPSSRAGPRAARRSHARRCRPCSARTPSPALHRHPNAVALLRRAWLQHECAGAHLANRRGSSAEHCPAARPLGSSRRLSAAHMRVASRWFQCNRRTSASILTRAGRALRIRRCRAALALCAAGLCALCPCAASLPINGAPFLGSPSTPRHGCQTQPPSSVSARSPEARPRMRVSSASRRPKQRGERRCLCTGRRELLAHRHVEP